MGSPSRSSFRGRSRSLRTMGSLSSRIRHSRHIRMSLGTSRRYIRSTELRRQRQQLGRQREPESEN